MATFGGAAGGNVRVFNYGSNGLEQLRARVGNPDLEIAGARAPGLARVFCLQSPNWFDGGVASLAPCETAGAEPVRGSVATLTFAEKAALDGFEKPAYREVEVDVEVRDDDGGWAPAKAVAYVAGDGEAEWTPAMTARPSEAYLRRRRTVTSR